MQLLYKVIKPLIVVFLIVYFSATFIFCLPDTSLPSSFIGVKAKFQVLFYQKWGFFKYSAPYNERLYYVVQQRSTGQTVDSIEVLKDLRNSKTTDAPFNQQQVTTDIILSRCMAELMAIQTATKKYMQTDVNRSSQSTETNVQCTEALQTLKNYAAIIASQHSIDTAGKIFKIVISQKYFNEVDKRQMPDPQKEITVFESSYNFFK